MKKIYSLLLIIIFSATAFAQAPNKMSYQAVIRNASNNLVINQSVGIRISVLQNSPTGTSVYTETQTISTNANGLVSLEIGGGTVVFGDFTTIDWGNGSYYIKTETDPTGGTSYSITGASQLLSVPYALYSKNSGNSSISKGVRIGFGNSTTWTCPAGVNQITVELWGGAGGGGGGSAAINNGCGALAGSPNPCGRVGGNGGKGGKGGYIKSILTVIPGNNYIISIGNGGNGGNGGTAIGYSGITGAYNGIDGSQTTFNATLIAQGGAGGGAGVSTYSTGCNPASSSNGTDGTDGITQNYTSQNTYIQGVSAPRSYIPQGYVMDSISTNCCSNGGNGGMQGVSSSLNGCNYAGYANGTNGTNGENGYCVISY